LREPLLGLLRGLAEQAGRHLLIAPEANAEQAGQPDVFLKDGPRLVGFVETKAPGVDLGQQLRRERQLKRYRESLPNWVLTDYYRFVFIREGKVLARVALADPHGGQDQLVAERPADLAAAVEGFLDYAAPVIRSPSRLADELARRARLLRDGLAGALALEPADGPLRGVWRFYRETLMSDLDEDGFADTFAQTIAYGMFLARLRTTEGPFRREMVAGAIPRSVPFLRSAVRLLTDPELLPEALVRLLDDLAALLENTEVDTLREQMRAGGLERDLVVYFYERFLDRYDKGERRSRGVYYTPPELVGYLARVTDAVLERDFGLDRGLADPSVLLLDPATGTGTFLLGMAERALAREAGRGSASERRLVREHLLRNFTGFELLPAPYAIAHLKLSSFYEQAGYVLGEDERLPIYLTNSLETGELEDGQMAMLPMLRGIVEEARAAGEVKARSPVLVITGNPPYERTGHNANEASDRQLESFYQLEGVRLPDRNTGPLRDDYLRFIRWSTWKLLEQPGSPGHGVLAFVTNRAFIERPLHRGVRRFLLERFDEINVFDLHGDQREWFTDRTDEKVFRDVQAGIAVTVFIKRPGASQGLATVRYREKFGTREEKLLATQQGSLDDPEWQTLEPHRPLWLFVPYDVPVAYDTWPSAAQLFPRRVTGVQTHRDSLVVAATEEELRRRLERFADPVVPDSEWIDQGIETNRDWNLQAAREMLQEDGPRRMMRWAYRPFDLRYIAFDERLIDYTRTAVSPHLLDHESTNLALAFAYGSLPDGPYAFVSRTPVPAALLSWRTFGQAHFAPLHLREELSGGWHPNLPPGLLDRLAGLGIEATPEAVLHYVYAVLNAPAYRARFAHGLRYDFPRVPIARDPEVFADLARCGGRLVALHLLEDPSLEQRAPMMEGDDRGELAPAPQYDPLAQSVALGSDLSAHPVSAAAWAYQQGAYRPLRDFLVTRAGRALHPTEFDDFRRMVAAVTATLDLLPEIDGHVATAGQSAIRLEELGLSQRV